MTRQIFAAEINFEDAPLHVREKFNESEKNVKRLLAVFKARIDEVYILATRHRFTVYVVHEDLSPLTQFFHTEHNLKGYVQYYYNSGESITHLMATASGLLSPVKGEGRVLTEITQCYQWAISCSTLGMTLDHALAKAIETAKAVKTHTAIDKFCASVVETGIELLYGRLQDLHQKSFLIVGTGKMAKIALAYLTREGITDIAVTGHDAARAQHLAIKYGVYAFPVDSIGDYFIKAEVIIGVSHEDLKIKITNREKTLAGPTDDRTRFILDLGIPPNFDARAIEPYTAEFYNLDDLRRLHASPLESFGGLEAAWAMIMKASGEFVHLLQLLQYSPVLTAYLSRQFMLRKGDLRVKPKKSLRNMLLFRKSESIMGTAPINTYLDARTHTNNHVAENGLEVVRSVESFKKFRFHLCEN
jgi:glutamyl-tRNA reductase